MQKISTIIRADKEFGESVSGIGRQLSAKSPLPIVINGLSGGAVYAYLAEAVREARRASGAPPVIMVGSDSERQRARATLFGLGLRVLEFKPRELILHNVSASREVDRERLLVLLEIARSGCDAVITTPSAALQYTMPRSVLEDSNFTLREGDEAEIEQLCRKLSSLGYMRVEMVESGGQFALRGGILDIWADGGSLPVRIEFFGDEIDRMVYFDPETQRATEPCESLSVLPGVEVMLDGPARARILSEIEASLLSATEDEVRAILTAEREALKHGTGADFRDKYIGLAYSECECMLSYLPSDERTVFFVLGTNEIKDELNASLSLQSERRTELISHSLIGKRAANYSFDRAFFEELLSRNVRVDINSFAGVAPAQRLGGLYGFRTRRTMAYGGNPRLLYEDIKSFRKGLYRTLVLTENLAGARSLAEALRAEEIAASVVSDPEGFDIAGAEGGAVYISVGGFEGCDLITPKIAVLSIRATDGHTAMRERRRRRIVKRSGGAGKRLMSYADLSVGDYVVHDNYGIGLFEGIETVTVSGVTKDYIKIRYQGTDKLFVPCDNLEHVGKYIGRKDDNGEIKLSKMGGGDWARAKSRAKGAAKNIAKELIALYAERQQRPGFAFPADSELEDEFAASFEYEETDSQLIAIEEIKADMMRPVPMNRLLCGDVGFGKTEIALRAAFKAIMGGKQVALLVPTTILALQHYQTALSRMRNYPVTVEMISRFRTPKQQELILRRAKRGEIDLLIGTHKLLSGKVEFRDLGLLIIDEEQRFGVVQKEKLKEMVRNVDTLSLSATPIPRTLNMAMNGISDMSILDEAPGERRAVQTYVMEYNETIVMAAIRKELYRSGQVLYLYNRIDDIFLVADKIVKAIPEARVAVAHGGMDKDELEDIWKSLVDGDVDVLVSTTIIETGVDLPNANTLIIEDADRMGLSQLHQIRGRVGRSERQAYAYFTYKKYKALSDVARRRLEAIRDFASFGAGFKIALRDLEIRGAGNLLGAEQHGYIESVGYDLYIKLLSDAVLEERGEGVKEAFDASVDIKVSAHIPERYIALSAQRMEMYKKISLIENYDDMQDILDEFIDRFGEPPRETLSLLKISLIRALAARARISKTELREGAVTFHQAPPNLAAWSVVFGEFPGMAFRNTAHGAVVWYRITKGDNLDTIINILMEYNGGNNE